MNDLNKCEGHNMSFQGQTSNECFVNGIIFKYVGTTMVNMDLREKK